MRDHLLGGGGSHVPRCLGVPNEVLEGLKAHVSDLAIQAAAKRSRDEEIIAAAREARADSIRNLSASLSQGTGSVNKRFKQSTVDECQGAALLDVTQQIIARMWYRCGLGFDFVSYDEVVEKKLN